MRRTSVLDLPLFPALLGHVQPDHDEPRVNGGNDPHGQHAERSAAELRPLRAPSHRPDPRAGCARVPQPVVRRLRPVPDLPHLAPVHVGTTAMTYSLVLQHFTNQLNPRVGADSKLREFLHFIAPPGSYIDSAYLLRIGTHTTRHRSVCRPSS